VKNTQYNPYLLPNRRNFHVVQEFGLEKLNGDVKFTSEMEIWSFSACTMKTGRSNKRSRQYG